MLMSRDRSRSLDVSRPIFDGFGFGFGLKDCGLGLGLEATGLGLKTVRDAVRSDGHRCRKCKNFLIKQV